MNPNKRLTQLVTLKQLNLNLIADLLNTPNVDLRKLENARDAQDYLNYQISLVKSQVGTPMNFEFPVNAPLFQDANETSSFASFKPSPNIRPSSVYNPSQSINSAAEWEFNARQLLPRENSYVTPNLTLPERNKEEIIFKPSQEQLSGVVRLPEDNWVQTLPKISNAPVQQKMEPIQEQLTIAPLKCETVGLTKDNIESAKFVRMPETVTEIEQAVKRDLQYLQGKITTEGPVTGIADPEIKEDIYTDPYSEYYN